MKHTYTTVFSVIFFVLFFVPVASQAQKTSFIAELKYSSSQLSRDNNTKNSIYSSFSEYFKKFETFDLPASKIHNAVNKVLDGGKSSEISLNLGDLYIWDLTLTKYDLLAPNYVHTEMKDGQLIQTKTTGYATYKGYANGKTENRVVLTLKDAYVNGFVMVNGTKHNIQSVRNFDKTTPSSEVVVFQPKDAIEEEGAVCDQGDVTRESFIEEMKKNARIRRRAAGTCIELAVAYDPAFNNKYNGNAVDEIIARVAFMSDWYTNQFNLDIEFKLVETHLEQNEEISPANKTSVCVGGDDLVSDIGEWGRSNFVNEHDIGAYWVARNICGSSCGVIGCATISGVCRNGRYNVNEDFFKTTERNSLTWAHEIGHNLGAQHSSGDNLMSASLSGQEGRNFGIAAATRNSITNTRDNASCLSDPCRDTPPVPDFRYSSDFCSLTTSFEDRSSGAPTSRTWDFDGDGTTDATSENPNFTYQEAGTYSVKLTATNEFGTNEVVLDVVVEGPRPAKPVVAIPSEFACAPATVDMQAEGTAPFNWYSVKLGGEIVSNGSSFSPALNEAENFFVTSGNVSQAQGGPTGPSAMGGYFSANDLRGLVFNVNKSSVLRSVVVDAETAGNRTVELLDRVDGNVLDSRVIVVEQGLQRVDLNFNLIPGNGYFIKFTGEAGFFRDNGGVNYPINIGDAVTLTGTNANSPGFYYFFYDWILDEGCVSESVLISPLVDVCQSLIDEEAVTNLSVFPSPNKGVFSVKLISNSAQSATVNVRNSLGQTVFSDQTKSALEYKKIIDLSSEKKGVYVITVEASNTVFTKKIVVE